MGSQNARACSRHRLACVVLGLGAYGLSVEQRKRLSIGLMEPTSGLDARAAAIVMQAVKNVSLTNRAVIITIHQVAGCYTLQLRWLDWPVCQSCAYDETTARHLLTASPAWRVEIFEAFDYLVLIQRGCHLTYFGYVGDESSVLIAYMEPQPGVKPICPGYNPATWYVPRAGRRRWQGCAHCI